jgi:hypothetical protein
MLHCPNEGKDMHPAPAENQFVLLALIRVGAHYQFKHVQEHYLENVLCRICGEPAVDDGDS